MTAYAPDMCLADTLEANAERFGDRLAYTSTSGSLTHEELHSRAVAIAAALAGLGLVRQDRIALLSHNVLEFGEVLAAAHLSGLVAATVNFRLTASERATVVADAAPRVLFCEQMYLEDVRQTRPHMPTLDFVVVIGDADVDAANGELRYEEIVAAGAGLPLPYRARAQDIACLIYTSGTTGASKGCILGQRELHRVASTMNNEMRTGADDRVLLTMPLFHIGAMAIGVGLHARGGCAVLRSTFEPAAVLESLGPDKVTVLHLAPIMLQALIDACPIEGQLEGVHTVVYSAAPMTGRTLNAALALMPTAGFLNLYGQTEVITSGLPRELHRVGEDPETRRRLSSVGHPFPDTLVRVVDDAGADLPRGVPGEIVVRSAAMFRGYWNNSVATAATIREGWCHTGDIGVIDHDGLIHLVDRKKDVVISGGENVYCPEVEDALLTLGSIRSCAVIGLSDDRWGEVVTAVVVSDGSGPTLEELREHLVDRLAPYKVPRRIERVSELPLLATGKIDKKALRAMFR